MNKRCYTVWTRLSIKCKAGGKVVWLSDAQLLMYQLKYPRKIFKPVVEDNLMEKYGQYINQTVD